MLKCKCVEETIVQQQYTFEFARDHDIGRYRRIEEQCRLRFTRHTRVCTVCASLCVRVSVYARVCICARVCVRARVRARCVCARARVCIVCSGV